MMALTHAAVRVGEALAHQRVTHQAFAHQALPHQALARNVPDQPADTPVWRPPFGVGHR